MEKKIAVYICSGCGIGDALDMEQISKVATDENKVPICRNHPNLCSQEGVDLIKNDIDNEGANSLVIAACSPRVMVDVFTFDNCNVDRVNLREQVAWPVAQLEDALLVRFPSLAELCAGIRLRMKSLAHVHLRALWRLADRYGEPAFLDAATRAQAYHRFDAQAVRRILERDHPLPDEPEPSTPLTAAARVLVELGDVDGGSLDDYAHLDDDDQGDDHGA